MNTEEYQHLQQLLEKRIRNLRRLEQKAADYGSLAIPTSLGNEIDLETSEIAKLQARLSASDNNLINEFVPTARFYTSAVRSKIFFVFLLLSIILVVAIGISLRSPWIARIIQNCPSIELESHTSGGYETRGDKYRGNGEMECAIIDYMTAIDLNSDEKGKVFAKIAGAYFSRNNEGDNDRAIDYASKAIDEKFPANDILAMAYDKKGERELAIEAFARSIKEKPTDKTARDYLCQSTKEELRRAVEEKLKKIDENFICNL